jgi:hypothetical protein
MKGGRVDGDVRQEVLENAEAQVIDVFRTYLGPRTELDDDFFEAGGVSLTAALCVTELRKSGLNVSIRDLFIAKTARRLADAAVKSAGGAVESSD